MTTTISNQQLCYLGTLSLGASRDECSKIADATELAEWRQIPAFASAYDLITTAMIDRVKAVLAERAAAGDVVAATTLTEF